MTDDKAIISIVPPGTQPSGELIGQREEARFPTEYVASGGRIISKIRNFLAAVHRRRAKPKTTIASLTASAGSEGALNRVLFVLSLEPELGRDGAIRAAGKKFNVSDRSIRRALAKAEAAANLLIQLRDLQLKAHRCVPRYAVSPR